MPAVHDQKAVLPAKVHSDDGADVQVTDTSRIIAGGDDVIAVIEALGLGRQVFAAPTNTTTQAGLAAPHQFLFNRTTGVEGVLSLKGSLFLGNSLRRHTELAKSCARWASRRWSSMTCSRRRTRCARSPRH